MKITTNHKKRELLSFWQLSERELKDFSYIKNMEEEGISRFFRYIGSVYDVNEFFRVWDTQAHREGSWENWNCYQSDSYFSGVLIRYSEDYKAVVVGRYYC